jgi:TLD
MNTAFDEKLQQLKLELNNSVQQSLNQFWSKIIELSEERSSLDDRGSEFFDKLSSTINMKQKEITIKKQLLFPQS